MKTNTKNSTTAIGRWMHFIAAIFMVALMVHAAIAAGPGVVNLGTAADFRILAKTGISSTGTTSITGDIGISPGLAVAISGNFALSMDASGQFSTSPLVLGGKVYAADYAVPTPAKCSTAVADMMTAYTDANSRAVDVTNAGSTGDLAGLTLVPDVYFFTGASGNVTISNDLHLSGGANDVWIFQITGTLDISANKKVLLSGGAQASNIFWAVVGTTTLEAGSTFEGNILAGPGASTIAGQDGAILHGRALGQTDVTLIGNTITPPAAPVITPPTVTSTDPVNVATGVALNKQIAATFSTAMDTSTITASTFTLMQGATSVSGVVSSHTGTTATFTPASDLLPNTLYTATITTGAKNLAGTALASNYVWSFTTAAAVVTPPSVISIDPFNTATGVALNKQIAATFSTAMDASTITASTFTLMQGTTSVSGVVSYSGTTATFAPASSLLPNTLYTATITTGAKNVAGTALTSNYVWSFTTAAAVVTPPTVTSTDPVNAATGVALNKQIAATFSTAMDASTITTSTFTLMQGTTSVSGVVSYTGTTATFAPASSLLPNTLYTATITTGAKNLAGTALASNYVWSFTTTAAVNVVENSLAPQAFALSQNYPNPFNPSTRIQYSLEKTGMISLKVYNMLGLEVATLVNGRQEAGSYTVTFNTNTGTFGLPSGVYFYRLEVGSFVSTRKLILMK
ncbi:MAG: Ig-like domain-containing protein [Bacteroidota bacterium]